MTLGGVNFGPADGSSSGIEVTYGPSDGGGYTATGCSVTVSHTAIECTTVEGSGEDLAWQVEVGGQRGDPPYPKSSYV